MYYHRYSLLGGLICYYHHLLEGVNLGLALGQILGCGLSLPILGLGLGLTLELPRIAGGHNVNLQARR
jgi:hypothetical protein